MTDSVTVIDDVLPADVYERLSGFISAQPLTYGWRSNSNTDPHGHWNNSFVVAGKHNLADLSRPLEADSRLAALDAAWKFLQGARLTDTALIRCYLNGYTYGTDGYFHTDSRRGDETTAIIYMNDSWEPDWAGETCFLDEAGDIVRAVLPRRNRAVIFPAHLLHAGRSVSRKCSILRKTLVFKARKKRSAEFERLSRFLQDNGATNHSHARGTLHDHLVRTFALLEQRGLDMPVCFGGGLHAIYGTNIFKHSMLDAAARDVVREEFGEQAENLAWLFSVLDRPRTLEAPVHVDSGTAILSRSDGGNETLPIRTLQDLRHIECANLLDQDSLERHELLAGIWAGR